MDDDDDDKNLEKAFLDDTEPSGDKKPAARRNPEEPSLNPPVDVSTAEGEAFPSGGNNVAEMSTAGNVSAHGEAGPDEDNLTAGLAQGEESQDSARGPESTCKKRKTQQGEESSYIMIKELKAFKEKHGHCDVPQSHGSLGNWVRRIRSLKKEFEAKGHFTSSSLNENIIAELDKLGINWSKFSKGTDNFELRFAELLDFIDREEHCVVPTKQGRLGRWVTRIRSEYRRFQLGEDANIDAIQIRRLDDLGFCWSMKNNDDKDEENETAENETGNNCETNENEKDAGGKDEEQDAGGKDEEQDAGGKDEEQDVGGKDEEQDAGGKDEEQDAGGKDEEQDEARKDEEQDEARKDEEQDEARKDEEQDEARKDEEQDEARKDEEQDEPRKDEEQDEPRKDEEQDEPRKNEETNDGEGQGREERQRRD